MKIFIFINDLGSFLKIIFARVNRFLYLRASEKAYGAFIYKSTNLKHQ